MTTRRIALGALIVSDLAIAAAYASAFLPGGAPRWAPWGMVLGNATMTVAIMLLGAARRTGGVGRLVVPFAFTFLVLAGGFGAALLLPVGGGAGQTLVLGLPAGAAVVFYGIGILPLLVLPFAYAWTFEGMTLSDADLERVRAAAARLAGPGGAGRGAELAAAPGAAREAADAELAP